MWHGGENSDKEEHPEKDELPMYSMHEERESERRLVQTLNAPYSIRTSFESG
jgi:hypothetical protein